MDSGNSGSLQSSSGGDDEYDSSSIIATANNNHPIFNPSSSLPQSSSTTNNMMFDPLFNFFNPPISPNQNPTMGWPKSLLNPTHQLNNNNNLIFTQTQPLPFTQNTESPPQRGGEGISSNNVNEGDGQVNLVMARNPKKRSRASRRAPTTVLTTDTTNFRAMVQEFTGIPAPPFTSSSSFPRSRIGLFGTTSSMIRSNNLPQHHNLLRPFAQKAQPLLVPPNNMLSNSSSILGNFDLSSNLGLLKNISTSTNNATNISNDSNIMQMQNQINTFDQAFLQSDPPLKYQLLTNASQFGSRTCQEAQLEIQTHNSHLKMGLLDELGLSSTSTTHQANNAHIAWLPNLVSKDNVDGSGYNLGTSSSNFQRLKGSTTTTMTTTRTTDHQNGGVSTTRGEGIMDSWLCSSD